MITFNPGNIKTLRFALPAAFIVSLIFSSVDFLRILSYLLATIPLHELGHALVAWMGGRWAIPLGAIVPTAGMTLISNSRSMFFIVIFFSLLVLGIYYFYTKQYRFHLSILLLIFALSCFLTFRIDEMRLASYISMAGILGEIILSTFLIVCFYYNLTNRFRWDFWRFPALLFGTIAFTNTALQWYRIKNNLQAMPMGSAISAEGARDMSGDLNQLILAGWMPQQIILIYWTFIKTSALIIVTYYITGIFIERSHE